MAQVGVGYRRANAQDAPGQGPVSTPEQQARAEIDRLLQAAGWAVQSVDAVNLHAARGVAIREFPLEPGFGFADYLLYIDGKACGVVEAKKQGATLTGVEIQSARYAQGLPATLPAWHRPLPFLYESTGIETHFTQGLDPVPRARNVFAFHQPDQLAKWLDLLPHLPPGERRGEGAPAAHEPAARYLPPQTFLARLQQMPELVTEWGDFKLWPAQVTAIRNLEASLAANKPRALIQMATGSGKTFTAIGFIYRLIKFAGARQRRAGGRRRRLPLLAGLCVHLAFHRRGSGAGAQHERAHRVEGCAGADVEGTANARGGDWLNTQFGYAYAHSGHER